MAMSLKSPFGQQSDTTPVPIKRNTRLKKTDDIVLPFNLESIGFLGANETLSNVVSKTTRGRLGDSVEKVYFLVNEPKEHWCLTELEIRTGVVTFYDSLGWAGRSRRR
ncbi:phospholipase-like protein [Tanacetum coccineum]